VTRAPKRISVKVLDLFAGIGGISLGLERAGFETSAFCERDGYASRILRRHWPGVPIFEDVRTLTRKRLKDHGIEVEVITGGFPCQDISVAGAGRGLDNAVVPQIAEQLGRAIIEHRVLTTAK
jgi:DNA (cytosine-5)-methyltransferase 1